MTKNKQYNSKYSIFYITNPLHVDGVDIITLQYSTAGNVTALAGYSDTVLARAGGGGYCKQSHALANALAKKYELEFDGSGQGINVVIKEAMKRHRFKIYDNYAVSELVYKNK